MTFIRVLVDTDKSEVCEAYGRLLEQVKEIMLEEQGVPESKQVRLSVRKPGRMPITAYVVVLPF